MGACAGKQKQQRKRGWGEGLITKRGCKEDFLLLDLHTFFGFPKVIAQIVVEYVCIPHAFRGVRVNTDYLLLCGKEKQQSRVINIWSMCNNKVVIWTTDSGLLIADLALGMKTTTIVSKEQMIQLAMSKIVSCMYIEETNSFAVIEQQQRHRYTPLSSSSSSSSSSVELFPSLTITKSWLIDVNENNACKMERTCIDFETEMQRIVTPPRGSRVKICFWMRVTTTFLLCKAVFTYHYDGSKHELEAYFSFDMCTGVLQVMKFPFQFEDLFIHMDFLTHFYFVVQDKITLNTYLCTFSSSSFSIQQPLQQGSNNTNTKQKKNTRQQLKFRIEQQHTIKGCRFLWREYGWVRHELCFWNDARFFNAHSKREINTRLFKPHVLFTDENVMLHMYDGTMILKEEQDLNSSPAAAAATKTHIYYRNDFNNEKDNATKFLTSFDSSSSVKVFITESEQFLILFSKSSSELKVFR